MFELSKPFRIQGQIIYLRLLIKDMMSLTLITQIGFLEIGHGIFFFKILPLEGRFKRPGPQHPMGRRWATFVSARPAKSSPEMSAK